MIKTIHSLSITSEDSITRANVNALLTKITDTLSEKDMDFNLSSFRDMDTDNSGEEYFDEGTLLRVYEAIHEYTASEVETREIITKMQNAGILFRERRP